MPRVLINLFHVLFVAPLFYQISVGKPGVPPNFLLLLGLFVLAYHAWRLYQVGVNPINLLHVLLVAPYLIYLGTTPRCTPMCYQLAFYLAIGVLVYHGSRLLGWL